MVTSGESSLSFGGMRAVADDVARRLWRAGVEPGNLVAVSMPKSIAQVAAVLGVLTAGAGYVPIDPGWPAERQQRVLEDAGVTAVICPAEAGNILVHNAALRARGLVLRPLTQRGYLATIEMAPGDG